MARINIKKPGPLSDYERKILRDVVAEYDSVYRVKVGTVATVVGLAANLGAIVLSTADGKMYACDSTGWVAIT